MAFKVNYGLERAERNRAKQAKKEAKREKKSQGEPESEAASLTDAAPPPPEAEPE